uniref:hypothetical protein n=1 Tax=uncultured Tenacibaculum sp. TaxID=174713 RepID=UPI0026038D10
LNFARKWFSSRNDLKALFPYAYFDVNRKRNSEIGFYGLHKYWKKHQAKLAEKELEKTKLKNAANARKRKRNTPHAKLVKAVNKYQL